MQIGTPVLRYVRVPWWRSAGVVVPATVIAVLLAFARVVGWPLTIVRRGMDLTARRLQATVRAALLLDLAAVACAVWLVFWGWPLVALSSLLGTTITLGMYVAAWISVVLTPAAMWYACRLWARQTDARWFRGGEYLFVSAHVLLVMLCLQWGIAGTTLAL
jgi:hypothetical protein